MLATLDSSIICTMSVTLSAFSPGITEDTLYLVAFLLSCDGMASYMDEAFPEVSIFRRSSSYRAIMSRFTVSTALRLLVLMYLSTACGIPPTNIYSLKSRISFLCVASPRLWRAAKTFLSKGMVTLSPSAHLNSSKSMGCMEMRVSSLGMIMD